MDNINSAQSNWKRIRFLKGDRLYIVYILTRMLRGGGRGGGRREKNEREGTIEREYGFTMRVLLARHRLHLPRHLQEENL